MGIFRDVTERKIAEAALAESEAKYRQLVETTDTGYLILDAEGLVVDANEEYVRISGHQRWLKSSGIAWWNGRRLMTGSEIAKKSGNAFKRGESDSWRLIISALMARLPPLRSMQASSPPRKAGVSSLFVGTSPNASRPRRHSAEPGRTSEIYNEMVEGCLISDIETKRFVRVNSSFCRMLGYSEEELLAASVQDIHPPEEVTNDLQRFQAVAESRRTINENRPVLRKDGSIFYADITGRRILYDGRPCVLALFRDVTERRQAQEALQESEEKYRTLVETSPDAVIMADLTGHVTFVSRRLLELHGAESADEFLGKTAWTIWCPRTTKSITNIFKRHSKTVSRAMSNTPSSRRMEHAILPSYPLPWSETHGKAGGNHKRSERHHRAKTS